MSTKQSVILTFMVLFMAGALYAIGASYHYSTELDIKKRTLKSIADKKTDMELILKGRSDRPGLQKIIDDPLRGLKVQLTAASALAASTQTDPQEGSDARRVLYEGKEPELTAQSPKSEARWKALFTDWSLKNKDISEALKRLKDQRIERDTKVTDAQTELDKELANEDTKRKEKVNDRRAWAEALGKISLEHEEVVDKVTSVTREVRKTVELKAQGKVIYAADDLRTLTLNIGSDQGVRRGMQFDVYSGIHATNLKKASVEITAVRASSCDGLILPPKRDILEDPQTGWVAPDPRMRYSVFSAVGDDDNKAAELVKPRSRADRIEAFRQDRLAKEQGLEAAEQSRREKETPSGPPVALGLGFVPIMPGDWVFSSDFNPIVSEAVHQRQSVEELLSMENVNIGSLTFYFTDNVKTYRREFLKRLCERNFCKSADAMTSDVNFVVTPASTMRLDLVLEKLKPTAGDATRGVAAKTDEEVSADIRTLRKVAKALEEAKRLSAEVVNEDELEAFFVRRNRKMELLRGKTIQAGQSTFYVAGQTRDRSVVQLQQYIKDNRGAVSTELNASVDYVVAGGGLDENFYVLCKKLGVKIIREDELPKFFGKE